MKFLLLILILIPALVLGQTKTTEALDKKYDGLSLFFYKNTLKMLNQKDSKELDEMIKDIEKMRFVMVDKKKHAMERTEYATLKKSYQGEQYEEMMTGRMEGRNFDILVKERDGKVKGTIILASDSASLYVLDILGRIPLDKASALFNSIDQSTDVSKMIKNFIGDDKDKKKKRKYDEEGNKIESEEGKNNNN
jgi:hypothetical protein